MNHLFDVKGKVAVVTGGTRGIGYMIAQGLLINGAKVYVVSRKEESCQTAEQQLQQYGQVKGIAADLSNLAQIQIFAEKLSALEPQIDILVNNAGATWGAELGKFPEAGWDKVLDTNLKSVFFLTQALLPQLLNHTSESPSRVINIGSIDGLTVPTFGNYSYSASKAAVHQLTKHLAGHLAGQNINVNAIAPGPFETKMTEFMLQQNRDEIVNTIPLKRIGQAEDIVGTVLFLASQASSFITGAVIPLDGGYSTTR